MNVLTSALAVSVPTFVRSVIILLMSSITSLYCNIMVLRSAQVSPDLLFPSSPLILDKLPDRSASKSRSFCSSSLSSGVESGLSMSA